MGTSGSATYTYDLFNRQKTHTSGGVVTTTSYRPDGLRHSIGGTKHIWDGQNIVGEYVGTTYSDTACGTPIDLQLGKNNIPSNIPPYASADMVAMAKETEGFIVF